MGRPRKTRPGDIRQAVDALVRDYETEGLLPTDFRLSERLGIGERELDGYYKSCFAPTEAGDGCGEQLRRLVQFRRQICVENLAQGKQATGWIFLSKQQRWGGMRDQLKAEPAREPMEIRLCGADGQPMKLLP